MPDALEPELARRQGAASTGGADPLLAERARRVAERRAQAAQQSGRYWSGLGRSLAQGATFGWADEAEAAVRALLVRGEGEDYDTAYQRTRDRIRDDLDAFRDENPWTATAAEVGGAILVPGLGMARAAGTFVARGATTMARVRRGAAIGAAEGAVYGAGAAEEMADVPGDAALGAAMGGGVGGVVPLIAAGAGAVRSALRPSAGADARIAKAMARDGLSPGQVAQQLDEARQLGRPAMVADVNGANVRRELEHVAQYPGAGADAIERAMAERNREMLRRVSNDLAQMAGGVSGDDVLAIIDRTTRARSQAAGPVYRQAMAFQAELNDGIVAAYDRAIATPLGKQALVKAKRILNVEKWDDVPLMERIDALKKGLDDVIGSAMRGGENQVARAGLQLLRNEAGDGLLDLVDRANPRYRQAREIWSSTTAYVDAIEEGRQIMARKVTAAQLKAAWRGLGDAEREAFRIGAVDAIVTRMRNESAQQPNLMKLLRSPEMMDKLTAIMSPADAKRLRKIVEIEDRMFETASQALRGSPTARRLAAQQEAEKQARLVSALSMVVDLATMGLRPLFFQAVPALGRAARDTLLARQNAIIAGRLMSNDPSVLLPIIARSSGVRLAPAAMGAAIPAGVAGAVGGGE